MDLGFNDVLVSVILALVIGLVWARVFSGYAIQRGLCTITCRLCGIPLGVLGVILLVAIPGASDPLLHNFAFSLIWAVIPAGVFCQWRVYPNVRFLDPPPAIGSSTHHVDAGPSNQGM